MGRIDASSIAVRIKRKPAVGMPFVLYGEGQLETDWI
jgi:hypothetical protein